LLRETQRLASMSDPFNYIGAAIGDQEAVLHWFESLVGEVDATEQQPYRRHDDALDPRERVDQFDLGGLVGAAEVPADPAAGLDLAELGEPADDVGWERDGGGVDGAVVTEQCPPGGVVAAHGDELDPFVFGLFNDDGVGFHAVERGLPAGGFGEDVEVQAELDRVVVVLGGVQTAR
jgi:hypothetical protein